MQVVFFVEKENLSKVKDITKEDPIGRQSITFRDNVSLGVEKEGNYLLIDGAEEACKEAQDKLKELAEELEGEEKEKVIQKMKEMEESAMEGFGGIFG